MSENYSGATQLDPALQEQLDRYGFSQVLVVHRQMAVLAASRPNFEQIDDHFLPTPVVLQSRTSGTVPHAGYGLGFERLLMFVTGVPNIRDVIPFARTPGHAAY